MKSKKIKDNKYIIAWGEKYFVVNEFTRNTLEVFYNNQNLNYLSKYFEISKRNVRKLYHFILNSMKDSKYYEDNLSLDGPIKIQWKMLDRCNLKCKHCYLGDLSQEQLSFQDLKKISNKIILNGIFEVTLTGGEVLLIDDLHKIIKDFLDNNIKVNIFTNGILLENFINKIKSFKNVKEFLCFNVSIDGLKKTHDIIRGEGCYDVVINNIIYAKKQGFKIITNSVLNSINYKEIPQLVCVLSKIGVDKIQISNLTSVGRGKDLKLNKDQKENFRLEIKKVINKLGKINCYYCEMPENEESSILYFNSKNEEIFLQNETWKCSSGNTKFTIDYNGDVYCCPFIKTLKLGNILNEDIEELWAKNERIQFIKLLYKINSSSRTCFAAKGGKID